MTETGRPAAARPLPLDGVRIVDLTTVLLGPYATQTLADHGAEVVKIEAPGGDVTRHMGPGLEAGMGSMFLGLNRGKRSVALDLKQPAARDAMLRLLERTDVLFHSMRAQKTAALGLSPQALRERFPRLIVVAAYGFGEGGPYAGRPAYDDIIQAACGMAGLFERTRGAPAYVPTVIADKVTGLVAAQAILMALLARTRDGRGSVVEVPMFETMAGFMLAEHFYGAQFEPPLGPPGYVRQFSAYRRPFATADGHVAMMPYTDAHWRAFFGEIGRPELASDPRFADIRARTDHIDALYALLESAVATRTTDAWLEACERLDVPATKVNRLEDLPGDPHLRAVGFFGTLHDAAMGTLRYPRAPIGFDGARPTSTVAPRLGEHTVDVLREAGLDAAAIDALLASGAARRPGD